MHERSHALLLIFALFSEEARAQAVSQRPATEYPTRAIRLIVPFPPGGSDTVARLVAQKLSDRVGQVQLMFGVLAPALPIVRSGRLRALAVTSSVRTSLAPEIPTVAEAGLKGYEAATWYGILAPAHTPETIVQQLSKHLESALKDADLNARLAATGFEAAPGMSNKEFGAFIGSEIAKWSNLVKRASISLE